MAKKLIKKLNEREIYAKVADYAIKDENGDKISDRKVKSVSVSGRTMTVANTDGNQEVPVVPVPDAAGLILKSGEDGAYEWGSAGAAPGHGKLILNIGNTRGVDTGFNADSERDVTFTIPEATDAADGLMSSADKAEFDRISGAAFDAKAEKSDVDDAVAAINTTMETLSENLEGEINGLDETKADKTSVDSAVTALTGRIDTTDSNVSSLESSKADKDTDAAEDNLAKFDSTGNPVDAGKSLDDVLLKEEIDRVTFRTVIDDLAVEPGEPLVASPDVTLISEIDESETVARRAYEDEFGNNIAESLVGKQDKLSATREDSGKVLGVRLDGSIGWISGGNLANGGTLSDGATVDIANKTCSTLQTDRDSITLNIILGEGELVNCIVEISTSRATTVRVTASTGASTAVLRYSTSKGRTLEAGKMYQITAIGTCWSMEEFSAAT